MGAPEWTAIIVAVIALVGVVLTAIISSRANQQLEERWRTELTALETRTERAATDRERQDRRAQAMEAYRWAAELAVSDEPDTAEVGVDQLAALLRSDLLDDDLKILVAAALESAIKAPLEAIEVAQVNGEQLRVFEATLSDVVEADVVSAEDAKEGEHG